MPPATLHRPRQKWGGLGSTNAGRPDPVYVASASACVGHLGEAKEQDEILSRSPLVHSWFQESSWPGEAAAVPTTSFLVWPPPLVGIIQLRGQDTFTVCYNLSCQRSISLPSRPATELRHPCFGKLCPASPWGGLRAASMVMTVGPGTCGPRTGM